MRENQLNETEAIDDIVATPYKFGFTTDIETEEFEKGLNREVLKKKLALKNMNPNF